MQGSNKLITCCFTGNTKLPEKHIIHITKRLNAEIDKLIHQGVTRFILGATPGFDQIAASLIVAKKEMGANIRLIFALSYQNQIRHFDEPERRLYRSLLREIDELRFISTEYTQSCIKERNCYMVDNSAFCICAFFPSIDEIEVEYAVNYAAKQGLQVINVIEEQ